MESYKRLVDRMDLQQIRAFLLNGEETGEIFSETYEKRIENGERAIHERLEQIYKDGNELDEALVDLYEALTTYEQVYTEIGMKLAAKLIFQLLQ